MPSACVHYMQAANPHCNLRRQLPRWYGCSAQMARASCSSLCCDIGKSWSRIRAARACIGMLGVKIEQRREEEGEECAAPEEGRQPVPSAGS